MRRRVAATQSSVLKLSPFFFLWYGVGVAGLDNRTEAELRSFAEQVSGALGPALVGVVLYGSAAGEDWIAGSSDLNTAIVVEHLNVAALDTLAPLVARWRRKGLALPLVVDREYLERARDTFPMEIEDIRRQHRVIAGADPFTGLEPDEATLRRECEQEAYGKLLRLRALYLEHADSSKALEQLMLDSLKSFLVLLRHLLRLRGAPAPNGYGGVLAGGEMLLGPLPAMALLLSHRRGARITRGARELAREYVAEAERIVAAVADLRA